MMSNEESEKRTSRARMFIASRQIYRTRYDWRGVDQNTSLCDVDDEMVIMKQSEEMRRVNLLNVNR